MDFRMSELQKPARRNLPQGPAEPITLDCDHVRSCAGGDAEQLYQMCAVFLNELPDRVKDLELALKREGHHTDRAVQHLRDCLLAFDTGPLTFTLELLSVSLRNGHQTRARREMHQLETQLESFVPQVQRLLLEVAEPTYPIQ